MRTTRACAALAAACLVVPVWASPAFAETITETASTGVYYLFSNPGVIDTPAGPQAGPNQANSVDGVAQDDLGVAVVAANTGEPDKFSALQFALFDLPFGATVSSAKLVVPISTTEGSVSTDKDPSLVVVCEAGPEGFGEGDGQPIQDAPSEACDSFSAEAKAVEGGNAFEFDITALAQKWTEANNGLLLYPSEAGFARPFQTVFATKNDARLTLSFTGGEEDLLLEEDFGDTSFDDTAVDDGGFGSTDLGAGGFDAGFDAGSGDTGTAAFDAVDTPAIASPDSPMPSVAGETPAVAQPIARSGNLASAMAFDPATWLAILGGAALLAVTSLALGAPVGAPGAAATATRPGGVASALARRRGAGVTGLRPV